MGYVMLSLTIILSAITIWHSLNLFWLRSDKWKGAVELADLPGNEADIVGFLLPRRLRRIWNFVILTTCIFLLGIFHPLAIWNFWRDPAVDVWHYIHYAWTLIYWLTLLVVYAFILAGHRESRRRQRREDS